MDPISYDSQGDSVGSDDDFFDQLGRIGSVLHHLYMCLLQDYGTTSIFNIHDKDNAYDQASYTKLCNSMF